VQLAAVPSFVLRASLSSADLSQITQENLRDRQQLHGKVAASLDLRGSSAGTHTLGGAGKVRLYDANIYELPLMVAMLKVLSIKTPDATAFTESEMSFQVQGEHLLFDPIDFYGDAVSLKGKGSMSLDKHINLTFHTTVGNGRRSLPVLRNLLGEASQQIMEIHVDGTLDEPTTSGVAFPVVGEALQQLQAELQSMNTRTPQPPQNPRLSQGAPQRR
jgi:hypothetical protein